MRHCIVCNSTQKKEYFNSSVIVPEPYPLDGHQSIVACKNCGFIFSDSDNTEKEYENYYKVLNKHKKRASDAIDLDRKYYEKIYNIIKGLDKDSSILDFGSGDLLMQKVLKEKGFRNIQTFDIGNEKNYKSKFDLILSTHVFEHILNGDIILQELANLLSDNGKLLLAVPDVDGYLDNYCGPFNWFDLEHINHFSLVSIRNFVEHKGLSVISCVQDRREVRPGLFYPEVIAYCEKNKTQEVRNYAHDTAGEKLKEYIVKPESDFNKIKSFINQQIQSGKKIIVRGVGIMVMRMVYSISLEDANIEFLDSNPALNGRILYGKKILSSDDLEKMDFGNTIILVLAVNYKGIVQSIPKLLKDKVKVFKY